MQILKLYYMSYKIIKKKQLCIFKAKLQALSFKLFVRLALCILWGCHVQENPLFVTAGSL